MIQNPTTSFKLRAFVAERLQEHLHETTLFSMKLRGDLFSFLSFFSFIAPGHLSSRHSKEFPVLFIFLIARHDFSQMLAGRCDTTNLYLALDGKKEPWSKCPSSSIFARGPVRRIVRRWGHRGHLETEKKRKKSPRKPQEISSKTENRIKNPHSHSLVGFRILFLLLIFYTYKLILLSEVLSGPGCSKAR